MARDKWIKLNLTIVCNMCKQYLSCNIKRRHRFDVTEDVNVKLYIHVPAACQNQIVGDANLRQNA